MITIKTENYNLISQDFYNKTIDSLDLNLISCVCGHSGCLIRYGSYRRSIQLADRVLSLSIIRVYCKACGHTHALLLSSMIPYSQIPLVLHVRLIHAYEHETGFRNILAEQYWADENNLKSIIRNYRLTLEAAAALHEASPPRYPQPDFKMFFLLFQTVHAD